MSFLEVNNLAKIHGDLAAVSGISLDVPRYRKTAIAGETGSGKSTLLKLIAGLEQPSNGSVVFEGKRVRGPEEQLLPGHPGIAYLSQHFELRSNYRVEELLAFNNTMGDAGTATLVEVCRVGHLLKRRPEQLSGGEKQRIALARLLLGSPRLLLLDEPFSNMDLIHKNILKTVLQEIGDHLRITTILTSHDPTDTLSWAHEIILMHKGTFIQRGTPQEVYHQPVNEYAGGLFGSYNLITYEDALLFPGLSDKVAAGKQLFIRPEQFIVSSVPGGAVAQVRKIIFWGAYYELELAVQSKRIIVRTQEGGYTVGDQVFVSVRN